MTERGSPIPSHQRNSSLSVRDWANAADHGCMAGERDWTESLASISSLTKVLDDESSPVGNRAAHELLWELAHLPNARPRRRPLRARADHVLHNAVDVLSRRLTEENLDELTLLVHKANDALRRIDEPGEWTLRVRIPVPRPTEDDRSNSEFERHASAAHAVSAEATYMIKSSLGILAVLPVMEFALVLLWAMKPPTGTAPETLGRSIVTWNGIARVLAPARETLLPMGALVVTMLTMLTAPGRNDARSTFTDRVQSVILTRIAAMVLVVMAAITIASTPLRFSIQSAGDWLVTLLVTSLFVVLLGSVQITRDQRILALEELIAKRTRLETLLKGIPEDSTPRRRLDSILVRPSWSTAIVVAALIVPVCLSAHRLSWWLELLVLAPPMLILDVIMLELTTRMHLSALAQAKQNPAGSNRMPSRLAMAYAFLLKLAWVLSLCTIPLESFGPAGAMIFISAAMAASVWYWKRYPRSQKDLATRYQASHWRRQLASCQQAEERHLRHLR